MVFATGIKLDGKLDEEIWKKANKYSKFYLNNTETLAPVQTEVLFTYDNDYLYLGFTCYEPNISAIKNENKESNDTGKVYKDDCVELMLSSDNSRSNYYHVLLNASGCYGVSFCSQSGSAASQSFLSVNNFKCYTGASIEKDKWIVEIAVPYSSLALERIKEEISLNFARNRRIDLPIIEESAIAEKGQYHKPSLFSRVKLTGIDLSPYAFGITYPVINDTMLEENKIKAKISSKIRNCTKKEKRLVVSGSENKLGILKTLDITLPPEEEKDFNLSVLFPKQGEYNINLTAKDKNKTVLYDGTFPLKIEFSPLTVDILKPVYKNTISATEKIDKIKMEIKVSLKKEEYEGCELVLSLKNLETSDNHEITSKKLALRDRKTTESLPIPDLQEGKYELAVKIIKNNKTLAENKAIINKLSKGLTGVKKVLNNFVKELLVQNNLPQKDYNEIKFINPKDGWVYIKTTAKVNKNEKIHITTDAMSEENAVIKYDNDSEEEQETMQHLSKGEHTIKIWNEGKPMISNLIVRSIPEIQYCQYSRITGRDGRYAPLDWKFKELEKEVFKNVNCMLSSPTAIEYAAKWMSLGRKWIIVTQLPQKADESYEHWSNNVGLQKYDGIIIDEFSDRGSFKPQWLDAVKKILKDEKFKGKAFYPYCGERMFGYAVSEEFAAEVIKGGSALACELYLPEEPTEEDARQKLKLIMSDGISKWKAEQPEAVEHTIMCLGYFNTPGLNVNPGVDYKVFMDMQFNMLANDPVFAGLYGVQEWVSYLTDEETIRWAGRLYRHYCIEGKTDMLSKEYGFKYVLDHIENPNFAGDAKGWKISPAEEGTLVMRKIQGLTYLEGQYPHKIKNDTVLWSKRSAKCPNKFSQEIKNIKPGKLYSVKMFVLDYRDINSGISRIEKHAVSINIDNADILQDRSYFKTTAQYFSNTFGKFNAKNQPCMNYHYIVFRAKETSSKLTISDWLNDKEPGGPIGQELIFNFIEIQPYLGPNL